MNGKNVDKELSEVRGIGFYEKGVKKLCYEKPVLTRFGDLHKLVLGGSQGLPDSGITTPLHP